MTNPSIYRQIEDIFNEIDSQVEGNDTEEVDAEEVIRNLTKDGGGIEVIGDEFNKIETNAEVIQSKAKEYYDAAYGMDGSTTKDLSFNNGLILSVAVAVASVTGSENVEDVSDMGTVSISAYFDQEEINIEPRSRDRTEVHFNQFPRVKNLSSDLPNWVNSIARTHAEGRHFERVSNNVRGPLFVDGPLLPADILIWTIYEARGSPEGTPMEEWSGMVNAILQSYVNGIENCVKRGVPVYGVQKSTNATRVIDALLEKEPELEETQMPFTNDGTLFNSALSSDSKDATITHTPWYVENKFDVGGVHGLVTPLKNYDSINLELGDYDDYKRAFFFAKPPTQTTVYRIGVPVLLLQSENKEKLKNIALSEMIKQFREPLPVVVADEKVRIPRDLRDKLRNLITSESHKGTNEQRGYT